MASRKSPLRDRLLSSSPDPLKSSILRESGMGWNPLSANTNADAVTSPLRIAKRDSPKPRGPVLARRTSSSYRHVHTNNLVSKSPFKSHIPTPSTPSRPSSIALPSRRVSGEKRPRPSSMHEQAEAENDRPFALKRERKQSKTFRDLIQKEPVTKSPFKNRQPGTPPETLPPPPSMTLSHDPPRATSTSPANFHMHVPATVSNPQPSLRSALVSRKMHGPRTSGAARRQRTKVTFYERCDVLEYDRESESEEDNAFRSCDEGERNDLDEDDDDDEFEVPLPNDASSFLNQDTSYEQGRPMEQEQSYESIDLSDAGLDPTVPSLLSDPDTSITGIVDEIFATVKPSTLPDVNGPITPPRLRDLPTDLETEDGVPFGRSHHVERFLQHHRQSDPRQCPHASPRHSPSNYPLNLSLATHASPHGPPATPPRRSPVVRHSTPPLGGSTHQHRIRQEHEQETVEEEVLAHDVDNLPVSPSPMRKEQPNLASCGEGLNPSFDIKPVNIPMSSSDLSDTMYIDPFAPRLQDEPIPPRIEKRNSNVSRDSMDPANLSADTDVSGIRTTSGSQETNLVPLEPRKCQEESRRGSPGLSKFQSALSRRFGSPAPHSASPLLGVRSEVPAHAGSPGRERISRDEVQRRLINQRQLNTSSPAQDPVYSTNSPHPTPPTDEVHRSTHESPADSDDKETNRLSVLTTQTDFSTETAIVETAEKKTLSLSTLAPSAGTELGLLDSPQLEMDFGSKFSLGGFGPTLHAETNSTNLRCSLGADKAMSKTESYESNPGIKMGNVDVDMDMKSALDRLMEDVAGAGGRPDDSMTTDEYDGSFDRSQSMTREDSPIPPSARPKVLERAATDSALLQQSEAVESRSVSGASTITEAPPPVPPKDSRTLREHLILQSRRRARMMDEEGDDSDVVSRPNDRRSLGYGRPSRRRSMSTGDAEVLAGGAKKRGEALLDIVSEGEHDDPLADSIEKALKKLAEAPGVQKRGRYHVREREGTIYASSSDEKVSHMAGAGDLDSGRAWRMVRRPSDMNEYAKQIKEYRAQDKSKAYGKVFVKVLLIKGLNLPLPTEQTAITCTLNNGIHFVTTPECDLSRECHINQEFELIEHSKLEFTLTFKVRRDPHIIAQYKALTPAAPVPRPVPVPAPVPPPMAPSKSYGMRSFFSSSPKKLSKEKMVPPPPPPQLPPPQPQPVRLIENLARYLKPDGTLARAFIKFKDVMGRCDTRLFETSYPLIGQRVEVGGKYSTLEVGEVVLQMFRLPPLPGLPQDQLPQSLDECHRGLRHINWHKVTYFQGTLTQNGGDCTTWRRRQLRITGSNLIAFNDVTKRATATIDLKKAIAVKDNEESQLSPDEYDGLCGVERSFRLIFPQNQEILFFADTEEEKAKWLGVLRALVGHIPPYPLWGELLWQRQEEIAKRMQAAQQTIAQPQPQGLP